jgi:hypothetical protein
LRCFVQMSAPGGAASTSAPAAAAAPAATAAQETTATWLTVAKGLGALFQRNAATGAVTAVNRCAMCDLFDRMGGKGVSGRAYHDALSELCGTTGDWASDVGYVRSAVVKWKDSTRGVGDGYPLVCQEAGKAFYVVPLDVQLATLSAKYLAELEKVTAAAAQLTTTEAELKSAREVAAGSACKLGKAPVLCNDGRERVSWTPETNDLLAGVQAEHTIAATAAGKIVGRVLETMAPHAELARMLLGGSTAKAGEAVGSRDVSTRAIMKSAFNAKLEFARSLLPRWNEVDGVWERMTVSVTFDATTIQPNGRHIFQVNMGALDPFSKKRVDFPWVRGAGCFFCIFLTPVTVPPLSPPAS